MAMNKKGQMIILKIMLAILVLITVIGMYRTTDDSIANAMNTTSNLNCTGSGNTVTTDATCIILDLGLFYFISSCLAAGLAFLTGKKTINGVLTAIFTTLVVVVLITPLKDLIILLRDASHLNCGSATATVGQQMLCIAVDLWLFYFVAVSIAMAITYITLKEFVPESE